METVATVLVVLFFVAMMAMLYRMEIKRYKAYIAKEESQAAFYQKFYKKLDDM